MKWRLVTPGQIAKHLHVSRVLYLLAVGIARLKSEDTFTVKKFEVLTNSSFIMSKVVSQF